MPPKVQWNAAATKQLHAAAAAGACAAGVMKAACTISYMDGRATALSHDAGIVLASSLFRMRCRCRQGMGMRALPHWQLAPIHAP